MIFCVNDVYRLGLPGFIDFLVTTHTERLAVASLTSQFNPFFFIKVPFHYLDDKIYS